MRRPHQKDTEIQEYVRDGKLVAEENWQLVLLSCGHHEIMHGISDTKWLEEHGICNQCKQKAMRFGP